MSRAASFRASRFRFLDRQTERRPRLALFEAKKCAEFAGCLVRQATFDRRDETLAERDTRSRESARSTAASRGSAERTRKLTVCGPSAQASRAACLRAPAGRQDETMSPEVNVRASRGRALTGKWSGGQSRACLRPSSAAELRQAHNAPSDIFPARRESTEGDIVSAQGRLARLVTPLLTIVTRT